VSVATQVTREDWPSWAKAMLVALALLNVAVILPWLLMWGGMASCMGMMGDMQRMMDMMPRSP
jgi:hypothetical protein